MDLDQACNLAVENIIQFGCSDITKENLELSLIKKYKDEFIKDTREKLNRGSIYEMEFKSIQYILTPKNRYVFDYRKAALINPSCLAKYISLTLLAAPKIEAARIPTSQNIIYSARFSGESPAIFNQDINYSSWKLRVKELANDPTCAYVVQCDIASFYDRVNIHRIESTLTSIGIESTLIKKINDLLLLWSKKDSYGIPVGNVASRILAEAALIDIDQYLLSENVIFVRYVDDYRLFAPDLITAQRWMNLLTTRLFRDGLMLNTGKTKLYLAKKEEGQEDEKKETPEEILKKVTMLTGGYNRIARTFIMPAAEKFDVFKDIPISNIISEFDKNDIPEFSGIQKLIIACLVQKKFDELESVAKICGKYLYSLEYFSDMLKKNADIIPKKNTSSIADLYAEMINTASFGALEWHQATLASLLSHEKFFRKKTLLHIAKSQTKESVTYPSMLALEGLKGRLTRAEFLTAREWFDRCDDWEKRRLISASEVLPIEERKAWGKAIKPLVQSDFLSHKMADEISKGK
ncbi:RNA-directed DNA polymerase [Chromobacterium vaccinii]|uniref:RNA-directed DNA polymerase n=1 Tax=Chromobacterium vaccinii TaxID=1108595 RepID=UPI001364ABE0|nr:RNA-directed DNA polymerase [Chromobacterium vaccinii]